MLRDIDDARAKRHNSMALSFETVWGPALDQLNVASPRRTAALNDVIDAHILYRCLRSSLDRAPQLESVRRDIESVRTKLQQAYEKLQALSSFKELEAADEDFNRRYRKGTTEVRRRIDDALLSRLFEVRSRSALGGSLREIDALLESVWAKGVERKRGQPRKYSKDFLILRCARIFERYSSGRSARIRVYREHPVVGPEAFDRGVFYKFVLTAFSVVVIDFKPTAFGLEKSVLQMLRVLKKTPDVDMLVKRTSTPVDLVEFARLSESKGKPSS
jgi:hypothetical protein